MTRPKRSLAYWIVNGIYVGIMFVLFLIGVVAIAAAILGG